MYNIERASYKDNLNKILNLIPKGMFEIVVVVAV